jgi:hypothetical protein
MSAEQSPASGSCPEQKPPTRRGGKGFYAYSARLASTALISVAASSP